MIISRNLRWQHVFHTSWKGMSYFVVLSVGVYLLFHHFGLKLGLPFPAVATLSTALAIYLGFKNNNAYERWWEARKIWGLIVNYSRAWARQVDALPEAPPGEQAELAAWKKELIHRHIAFVHALRVYLRSKPAPGLDQDEGLRDPPNSYDDLRDFLDADEFERVLAADNPPNLLLHTQGHRLHDAYRRGWLTDFRVVQLEETLVRFNNHQGRCERIKSTPLPRPYSFYSRLFVFVHGTIVPFAFIESLGWANIPLSLAINYVFFSLDIIGELTEDPFENRITDVAITDVSLTIEGNLKETHELGPVPDKPEPVRGAIM